MAGTGSSDARMNGERALRLATPADAEQVLGIYRPFVTESATSFELVPPSAAEIAQRITTLLQRLPWLVCVDRNLVLGYAYASPHRDRAAYQWSVEVSAYVRSTGRRSGIARQLYGKLFELLSLQGFFNAYAGITLPNDPSLRFHEALGFSPVGVYHGIGFKFGRWHDVAWYERALQRRDPPRTAPVPFSDPSLLAETRALLDGG